MPVRKVRVRSLAKINLDLRILNKRPDGFHELRTLFQTVSLADTIELSFTPGRLIQYHLESDVEIANNLILQAAALVMQASRAAGGLRIRLKKRIPMGGGLGGGSSNAAAILLALPALTGKPLPLETLLDLAAQLGSDVPFFLLGGMALGLGRGTELYPIPEPRPRPALLVTPGVHVSTASAYAGLNRELTSQPPLGIMNNFQSLAWQIRDAAPGESWKAVNDFETVVFSQYPQLKSIKGKLRKLGASLALMSGSGSTLFGIFASRSVRDHAAVNLESALGANRVHKVSLVSRNGYRALWRRQLSAHIEGNGWPPRSRYSR